MTQAGDHHVAAVELLLELLVAQRDQVGHDHRQERVVGDARREPLRRPDHGAHADTAAQKLLQDAATGAPGAAQDQNVHDFPSGYWNTSSSGTLNARAI